MSDERPKGHIRKLWSKHGGGYYALVAVGTFLYLEIVDLWAGISSSGSVEDFVVGELVTFGIESLFNTFRASIWPIHWFLENGWTPIYVVGIGYVLWTVAIAAALDSREKAFRKDLGL